MNHILLAGLEPKGFFFGESKTVECWSTNTGHSRDPQGDGEQAADHVLARDITCQ